MQQSLESPHEALQAFLSEQNYRGNSGKTLKNYETIIELFLRDMSVARLEQLNFNLVTRWLGGKRGSVSPITMETYDRHLRLWVNWLHQRGYIAENFFAGKPRLNHYALKVHRFEMG